MKLKKISITLILIVTAVISLNSLTVSAATDAKATINIKTISDTSVNLVVNEISQNDSIGEYEFTLTIYKILPNGYKEMVQQQQYYDKPFLQEIRFTFSELSPGTEYECALNYCEFIPSTMSFKHKYLLDTKKFTTKAE